jgi:ribosomal-protein-alanine N-acetyltransferase
MTFTLIRCATDGSPVEPVAALPAEIEAKCTATADLYRRVGFVEPWVGYVAVDAGSAVGGGAFVGPPRENRVEIAYYTLKEFEGRGFATQTAAGLVAIARRSLPGIVITAFTLPEQNASTRILQRLGFELFGDARDPDAGDVWEWRT